MRVILDGNVSGMSLRRCYVSERSLLTHDVSPYIGKVTLYEVTLDLCMLLCLTKMISADGQSYINFFILKMGVWGLEPNRNLNAFFNTILN